MKNYFLFLIISGILSSCYSYKDVASNEITTNKHYKIKTAKGKYIKVKVDSIKGNTIIYKKKKQIQSLEITEKSVLKERKFSTIKTVLLPVGIVGGLILVFDHAMSNMEKNIDLDIQPPP